MSDVTQILEKVNTGKDPKAREELLKAVYQELRVMAQSKMNRERPGHTLQPTILVNDAWLKLFPEGQNPQFKGRAYFFGAAAEVMRRVLIDHARGRNALKRGVRVEKSETEFAEFSHPAPDELLIAVDEALKRFAETDKDTAKLIELRFFVGLSMKQAAEALGISVRSGERDCAYFMAWFRREFGKEMNL
jgi:RNA polymerase sigma factor (TIGR02999 family)